MNTNDFFKQFSDFENQVKNQEKENADLKQELEEYKQKLSDANNLITDQKDKIAFLNSNFANIQQILNHVANGSSEGIAQSEAPKSESAIPEAPKIETPIPEAPKSEATQPEAVQSETPIPEVPKSEATQPKFPDPFQDSNELLEQNKKSNVVNLFNDPKDSQPESQPEFQDKSDLNSEKEWEQDAAFNQKKLEELFQKND